MPDAEPTLNRTALRRLQGATALAEAMMDEATQVVMRRMPNVNADHRMTMVAAVLNAIASNYHAQTTAPKS